MKHQLRSIFYVLLFISSFAISCVNQVSHESDSAVSDDKNSHSGQSAVKDDLSERNIVQVAVSSPDHTILVKAVTQAKLVDALSNVGPFTVFAPVDAAFNALPGGTLETLMKPENEKQLIDILEYHVYVGVIREDFIGEGMTLNQVNGKNAKLIKSAGKIMINDATVLASVKASNGIVYVIDKVLVP